MLDDLVQGDVPVEPPEREREPGARGRQRLEAECGKDTSRARVPGVGDHERLPRVEAPERCALLALRPHGESVARPRRPRRPRRLESRRLVRRRWARRTRFGQSDGPLHCLNELGFGK